MSTQFMVTVTGADRSGLVRQLAEKTHLRGGKWLDSKIVHLEGLFAGIIKIDIPDNAAQTLKKELQALEGLELSFAEPSVTEKVPSSIVNLNVKATDRPGIISDITHLLMDNSVSVEHMECHRFDVSGISNTVFSANLVLAVPLDMDSKSLVEELEALGDGMRVELEPKAA